MNDGRSAVEGGDDGVVDRGRNCLIASLARVGWTRFDSSTTQRARGGSIHTEQPVKPRWPTPSLGQRSPADEPVADGRSQPRHQVEPGTPAGVHCCVTRSGDNSRGVEVERTRVPRGDERVRDARDVARRREQPGVTGDAAHGARIVVVDHAAQVAFARSAGGRVARAKRGADAERLRDAAREGCIERFAERALDGLAEQDEAEIAVARDWRRAATRAARWRRRAAPRRACRRGASTPAGPTSAASSCATVTSGRGQSSSVSRPSSMAIIASVAVDSGLVSDAMSKSVSGAAIADRALENERKVVDRDQLSRGKDAADRVLQPWPSTVAKSITCLLLRHVVDAMP